MKSIVKISNANICQQDNSVILQNISLHIGEGEFTYLIGKTGSGKSSLLKTLYAALPLTTGHGEVADFDLKDITRKNVHLLRRKLGIVFQDFNLLTDRNVAENLLFVLRATGWTDEADMNKRMQEVLTEVGLIHKQQAMPYELSGGEQQRVALARALAPAPRLLLLDEPLGALDRALRERLIDELRRILQQVGSALGQVVTAIYVTHDQAEAFALGDELVVMNRGRIEQQGTPITVFQRPQTPFVARFLGLTNLLDGHWLADGRVQTAIGPIQTVSQGEPGTPVTLLIRPEAGQVVDELGQNGIRGRVVDVSFRGREQHLTLSHPNLPDPLTFILPSSDPLPPPETLITLHLDPRACWPVLPDS